MKKITLLLLMFVATAGYSQSNLDQMYRSRDLMTGVEITMKHDKNITTPDDAFATNRMDALKAAKITLTEEQEKKLLELFKDQYQPLSAAYSKFKEGRTPKTRLDLYSLFVKNEEDFRALITPEQMLTYLRFQDKHSRSSDYDFHCNFMDDKTLKIYKDEIK